MTVSVAFTEKVVLDIAQIAGFTNEGVILNSGTLVPLAQQEIANLLFVWQRENNGHVAIEYEFPTGRFVPVNNVQDEETA